MALSEFACRKALPTAKKRTLADDLGLSLLITVHGRKAWHFRFRWGGVAQLMTAMLNADVEKFQSRPATARNSAWATKAPAVRAISAPAIPALRAASCHTSTAAATSSTTCRAGPSPSP